MKKITLLSFILTFLFYTFPIEKLLAQGALVEIPLNQQVEKSELIIEGKVIAKEPFWDMDHKHIYTKNTVEVYKVFKGQVLDQVEIITRGGTVGLQAEEVIPSLQLSKKVVGFFFLNTSNVLAVNEKGHLQKFKTYSGPQGFYRYDTVTNKVNNVFRSYSDIESVFYDSITSRTMANYKEVVKKKFERVGTSNSTNKSSLAVVITSISPPTISAGTGSVLTINGSGFGFSEGKIEFNDADDGGSSFIEPLPHQITWGNAQILVEVPSGAGTGIVKVTHQFDGSVGQENLTISYSQLNSVSESVAGMGSGIFVAYPRQHIEANGSGGYSWQMTTDFNNNILAKASFLRALDTWRCTTGINWIVGTPTGVDEAISGDGVSIVRFGTLDDGILGQYIGYTTGCFTNGNTSIDWRAPELDIEFDDDAAGLVWEFGPDLAISGEIDFESVAVHELGHAHQLGHVIDPGAIMHWQIGTAQNSRNLSQNDIDGATDVYDRSTTAAVCSEALMAPYAGVCPPLSMTDEELNNNISLFPNPSNGKFYIQKASYINLEKVMMYDISGRLVSEHDISGASNTMTINLRSISSGVYFANIHSDFGVATKRIVLE